MCTILNDDASSPATLAISDVAVLEGQAGAARPNTAEFRVSLSGPVGQTVTVAYATQDGTAAAGSDYVAAQRILTFAPSATAQTRLVHVVLRGDSVAEANETFMVNLSDPVNAAIADFQGLGTILNDDADTTARLEISDVSVPEGGPGATAAAVLSVRLSQPSPIPVTVRYSTNDVIPQVIGLELATPGHDFATTSGTLTFVPGESIRLVTVQVRGDSDLESNETFSVSLSAAVGAVVSDGQGQGTILNDDGRPLIVTGADFGGGPHVRVLDAETLAERFGFFAYASDFTGGVRVATGDVTGDGQSDIIAAPGRTGGPHIRVFDGQTGQQLPGPLGSFFAFDLAYTGGLTIASADVNNDLRADLIVGQESGDAQAPRFVRIFDGRTGAVIQQFEFGGGTLLPFGMRVAAGDVNGDRRPDVVIGSGPGGPPRVVAMDSATGAMIGNLLAYDAGFRGGVHVATGDVNGDGRAEIITGAGEGGGPHVRILDALGQAELRGFFAYPIDFTGGVRVAAADLDGDGRSELITGAGPDGGPHVKVFDGATGREKIGFFAYPPDFRGGVLVAGATGAAARVISPPGQVEAAAASSHEQLFAGGGPWCQRLRSEDEPTDSVWAASVTDEFEQVSIELAELLHPECEEAAVFQQ
jgi:hypothetical protein